MKLYLFLKTFIKSTVTIYEDMYQVKTVILIKKLKYTNLTEPLHLHSGFVWHGWQ